MKSCKITDEIIDFCNFHLLAPTTLNFVPYLKEMSQAEI